VRNSCHLHNVIGSFHEGLALEIQRRFGQSRGSTHELASLKGDGLYIFKSEVIIMQTSQSAGIG
jgi:hypothetical protein